MKKTLLAAALLAGFAGAASAQTNVTLYGVIDIGLGYNKVKMSKNSISADTLTTRYKSSASRLGMVNGVQNGSRWGLRGTEDLGDGLRAVFQLENGFNPGSGNLAQSGRLFGRHATLGLASDSWGQLDLGRQTNMASKYFGSIDPFAAAFTQSNLGHSIGSANTRRLSNMVLYRTPDIEGFQAGVGYSFDANNQEDNDDNATAPTGNNFRTKNKTRSWTAGIRYLNGPLNVAVSYDQARASSTANQKAKPKIYAIGAAYDFEVVKVSAAYARTSDGWMNGQRAAGGRTLSPGSPTPPAPGTTVLGGSEQYAKGFRANSFMLGLSAPIADGSKVFTSWQHIKPKNNKLTGNVLTRTGTVKKNDETTNVYSLGYTYDFSKRTNLYSYLSYATNYSFIDGAKSTAAAVGLRHRF